MNFYVILLTVLLVLMTISTNVQFVALDLVLLQMEPPVWSVIFLTVFRVTMKEHVINVQGI